MMYLNILLKIVFLMYVKNVCFDCGIIICMRFLVKFKVCIKFYGNWCFDVSVVEFWNSFFVVLRFEENLISFKKLFKIYFFKLVFYN